MNTTTTQATETIYRSPEPGIYIVKHQTFETRFVWYKATMEERQCQSVDVSYTHTMLHMTPDKVLGELMYPAVIPEVDALPKMSAIRVQAYQKWQRRQMDRCYELILKAYPELLMANITKANGEICQTCIGEQEAENLCSPFNPRF